MLRRRLNKDQKARVFGQSGTRAKNAPAGQVFLEYTMVIGAVVLIIFAMSSMLKRGTQGMIKVVADQLGNQQNSEQLFDIYGSLNSAYTSTRSVLDKTRNEFLGNIGYIYQDTVTTRANAVINLGFTNDTQR